MSKSKIKVVGDSDTDLTTRRFLPQYCETMQLLLNVKKGGRLVQENYRSVLSEARSEQHALPLAAAEGAEQAVAMLPAVSALHGLPDEGVVLFGLEPSIRVRISAHRYQLLSSEGKVCTYSLG